MDDVETSLASDIVHSSTVEYLYVIPFDEERPGVRAVNKSVHTKVVRFVKNRMAIPFVSALSP